MENDAVVAYISEEPLSVAHAVEHVSQAHCGGVAIFVGQVRNHDDQRGVVSLSYSAHPRASTLLQEVAERVVSTSAGAVSRVYVAHRVGDLQVGDAAVVVATSSAHRAETFAATRTIIEELKRTVPIWKNQVFADGAQEWVGLP